MSTEPYPEVSGDESGIVPPQNARPPEWPKKIRTLTAAELDRLTIDSSGRFYWDGNLVNYEPPKPPEPKPSDDADRSAMDIIERATYELGEHKTPEPIEGAELPKPISAPAPRSEYRAVDLDVSRAADEPEGPHVQPRDSKTAVQPVIAGDRLRLSLSRWQSLGAFIVVLCIALGASGVAAYGWVVAHDWGCRIGVIKSYCPAVNPGLQRSRPDIPA
jgi:hypothetical protein